MSNLVEGKPLNSFLKFLFPMLVSNIVTQSFTYIDTAIIGRNLGYQALSAIGVAGNITTCLTGFLGGICSGVAIVTAKFVGNGNKEIIKKSISVSFLISLFVGIVLTVFVLPSINWVLSAMRTPEDIIPLASTYLFITTSSYILQTFLSVSNSLCIALGDSKFPMLLNILTGVLKAGVAYLLVAVFHLGITGAAVSTVLVLILKLPISTVYLLKKYPVFRLKKCDFKYDFKWVKKHLIVGLALALQNSVTGIGKMFFQLALNGFSSIHIAAFTASVNIENIMHIITCSISSAATTFISYNFGAGKFRRVKYVIKLSLIVNLFIAVFMSMMVFALCEPWILMLLNSASIEKVLPYAKQYTLIVAGFYPVAALLVTVRCILQGIGHSFVTVIGGIAELMANIFVAFYLAKQFGFIGIAFACPISWILASTPLVVYLICLFRKNTLGYLNSPTKN